MKSLRSIFRASPIKCLAPSNKRYVGGEGRSYLGLRGARKLPQYRGAGDEYHQDPQMLVVPLHRPNLQIGRIRVLSNLSRL